MATERDPFLQSAIGQPAKRRLAIVLLMIVVLWLCILWAVSLP